MNSIWKSICSIFLPTFVMLSILPATNVWAYSAWQGHETQENGVRTVYNPALPYEKTAIIRPEAQWRLGDDDSDIFFGLVTDAQRTPDGTTYLIDSSLSTVYEIDAHGEVQRTLGREGDGPGEFRNARSLVLMPEGGIGIVETMPGNLVVLDKNGLPRPSIDLGDGGSPCMVPQVRVYDGGLIMSMNCTKFDDGEMELGRTLGFFDENGILKKTIFNDQRAQKGRTFSMDFGVGDFVNRWTNTESGNLIVFRDNFKYMIEIFGPDGREIQRIHRNYTSLDRPQKEVEDEKTQIRELAARFGTGINTTVQTKANDIAHIIPRSSGKLWVLSSEGTQNLADNTIGTFDVFTATGRFERQITIEVEYDREDDLFLVRGNYLYVLKEARNTPATGAFSGGSMMVMASNGAGSDEDDEKEADPYEVICYKLPTIN